VAWPTRRHARANAVFSSAHAPPRRGDDAGGDRRERRSLRNRSQGTAEGAPTGGKRAPLPFKRICTFEISTKVYADWYTMAVRDVSHVE